MRSPVAPVSLAAALAVGLAGPARAGSELIVLHVNDFHSRIEQTSATGGACSAKSESAGECFGGIARLATALAQRRAAAGNTPVLFLNAGDVFQGSLFHIAYRGLDAAELFGRLGVDAMALGNHEFDHGPQALAAFLDAAPFPVLAGNAALDAEPLLAGKASAGVVLEVGGEKVGIIVAVTEDTAEIASPGPNVRFAAVSDHLTQASAAMAAQGVRRVIALTHVGIDADMALARSVPGIDAFVGGHSHTEMADGVPGALDYPQLVTGPDGRDVPVVHAGAYGKWLGELRLSFDDAGMVTAADGAALALAQSIPPDPAIAARVAELAAPLAEIKAQVVAETAAPIDAASAVCRVRECEMGALVAQAMLDRVKGQGVRVAITNGGGLRAPLDAGPVTMGEMLTVLPFQNTLATVTLTGADILAALENGLSRVEEGAGRFPQVAGLRYVWDGRAAPGARVASAEVAEGAGWAPLDPAADYGVVTNDYLRRGGDGYAVFRDRGRDAYDFGPGLEDVVADWMAARGPVAPFLPGLIRRLDE